MKKAYFFLDVDGVLNCRKSPCKNSYCLDPCLLNNWFRFLAEAEKKYEVQVILSSTWRFYQKHLKYLKKHGVVWSDTTTSISIAALRSWEIIEYIDRHNLDYKSCWVFDDMVSNNSFLDVSRDIKVIATTYEEGFNSERYDYAREKLNV